MSESEADYRLLDAARKLEFYGLKLHNARVSLFPLHSPSSEADLEEANCAAIDRGSGTVRAPKRSDDPSSLARSNVGDSGNSSTL